MKSDSNKHRTTLRSGDRNDAQGDVVTKGNNSIGRGNGNRYSVQSAYLSAISAKSSSYTVNNENAYPEYRPSKPIFITNQQQTFITSQANAATITAIASSTAPKLMPNNSKYIINKQQIVTTTTAPNATTSKSHTTTEKKMENLQSSSSLHTATMGRYDGVPEEKSQLNASNHALRGGSSHHYSVQSRYLAAIHRSKSNDIVGGMLENTHSAHHPPPVVVHPPLNTSSMVMMTTTERSVHPTAAQHTSSSGNMSAIELKREYLLSRERSLSKSRDTNECGNVMSLSKSNDDDEDGGGGGGKSPVSASTSGKRDMQSIYLSALKPCPGHKSAVELQKEYLMNRSLSRSHDDEGGIGMGMGTDRNQEERSPLSATINQANSKNSKKKKKKKNSSSSSSSVQSIYLSALNSKSDNTLTASNAASSSSSPIVNVQPSSSNNNSYGQQSSHDGTECVLSSRSIQQVASADTIDDGDLDHALRERDSTIIKPSINNTAPRASSSSSGSSKEAVIMIPVIEATAPGDKSLCGIAILQQDDQQCGSIDNLPTHLPHGIMNTHTHTSTQLIIPSQAIVKDTVLNHTQSYPCHDDILSALELEIVTLMRTDGWSRETAVRILLAKSSSESQGRATASDQQQIPSNIMNNINNMNNNKNNSLSAYALPNDKPAVVILGIRAASPSINSASNYHPTSNVSSHQLIVNEHQKKVKGKEQVPQHHPVRGSQQSNSHRHPAAAEKASSSHTNKVFDHQPYIRETHKAPTNHHPVNAQEKQPNKHRVVQSHHVHEAGVHSSSSSPLVGFYQISGQGQGQGHRSGIPRSHPRFTAAPDEGPDWGSLSSLSLSGSECEEGTEV